MARTAQLSNAALPSRARSTRYLPMALFWQVVVVVALLLAAQRTVVGFVLAGAVVLLAMLATLPVNGRSLFSTLRVRAAYGARRRQEVAEPDQPAPLVPLGQWLPQLQVTQTKNVYGGEIGVVADGTSWTGLLELTSDDALVVDRGSELDLELLGTLTRQDDVVFAGIQVVTMTVPAPTLAMLTPGSPAQQSYLEIVGEDVTPPAVRRTWVALRLDPRLCLEAVARRGSGQVGVFATLRFGLHRAQAQLKRQGVSAQALDPSAIAEVLGLTSGAGDELPGERTRETWQQLTCDGLVHETRTIRSFGPNPTANYQALLDSLAQSPAMMVFTSFTVSPGQPPAGAIRHVTHNEEQAAAADEELVAEMGSRFSFGPLGGTQVPGLLATIPLGRQVEG
ncbi:type VII secretion protein EccE [Tessaracoccus sp. OS52]|uniref:type VII secretion protein EccE n=1 Tax=Tessaracoccus sp. OS52 TaxID=2886691 RepID=UPI001D129775|nr:type VII secretion protein EccE [Tessaracoccus sp. OS52]MCC2594065.1 type VII secretion protein EccE [Tessaracoccus sp. OS52]